jgi:hypothetical protein
VNHSIERRVAIVTLADIRTAFIQTGYRVRKIDKISVSVMLV